MQLARTPLLTEAQAAEYLNIPAGTLEKRRVTHISCPPYRKLGDGKKAPVRYHLGDLDLWLEGRYTGPIVVVAGGSRASSKPSKPKK